MSKNESMLRLIREVALETSEEQNLQGYCVVLATLVRGLYGGDIVRGRINGEPHYWNRIDGEEIDLTSCQFGGDGFHPLKKGVKVPEKDIPELVDPNYLMFYGQMLMKLSGKEGEYEIPNQRDSQ